MEKDASLHPIESSKIGRAKNPDLLIYTTTRKDGIDEATETAVRIYGWVGVVIAAVISTVTPARTAGQSELDSHALASHSPQLSLLVCAHTHERVCCHCVRART